MIGLLRLVVVPLSLPALLLHQFVVVLLLILQPDLLEAALPIHRD